MRNKGYIISLLFTFVMIFVLAACESGGDTPIADPAAENKSESTIVSSEENVSDSEIGTDEITELANGKSLVVYFSRIGEQYVVGVIDKGNTAIVAEMIAEKTGSDMWEVIPEEDYPMTYSELTDVAKKEQNENARPKYRGTAPDLSEYDTVFVGAPVWWGDWPMIMYTFFEQNRDSLADKTLIPFSTHEGSGLAGFDRKLRSAVPSLG